MPREKHKSRQAFTCHLPISAPATLNAVVRQGLEGESRLRASREVPFNVNFKTAVGGTNVDMFLN